MFLVSPYKVFSAPKTMEVHWFHEYTGHSFSTLISLISAQSTFRRFHRWLPADADGSRACETSCSSWKNHTSCESLVTKEALRSLKWKLTKNISDDRKRNVNTTGKRKHSKSAWKPSGMYAVWRGVVVSRLNTSMHHCHVLITTKNRKWKKVRYYSWMNWWR